MLGPILYWDLVRHVRRPAHFRQRASLAAIVGGLICLNVVGIDFRSVGALARASMRVADLAFTLQTLAIYLLVPAMLAGSICDDRKHGRLDSLLAAPLSRRRLVAEKLLVGVGFALLSMIALAPFTLLGPIMGGVSPDAVLKAEVASAVETLFVAVVTLLVSARSDGGGEAMVKSYALLFALRYGLPEMEMIALRFGLVGAGHEFSAWFAAVSPAAADRAAWSPPGAPTNGPTYWQMLLVSLGLVSLAFELTVRSIDRSTSRFRAERPSTAVADEAMLDADPLVWRAVHLRVYDRRGVWRRVVWMLTAVFVLLGWAGASNVLAGVSTAGVIIAIVFLANATLPAQWLINERKSGWFGELQLTPVTMDDVLRASLVGTSHHLRPLWRAAGVALVFDLLVRFVQHPSSGFTTAYCDFFFLAPAWLAYWSSVREGLSAGGIGVAVRRVVVGQALRFLVGLPVLVTGLGVSLVLWDNLSHLWGNLFHIRDADWGLLPLFVFLLFAGLAAVVIPGLYLLTYWKARTTHLRRARATLHVLDKTANFGRQGGDVAWEDWPGVPVEPGGERLTDVYYQPLPRDLFRPRRVTPPRASAVP